MIKIWLIIILMTLLLSGGMFFLFRKKSKNLFKIIGIIIFGAGVITSGIIIEKETNATDIKFNVVDIINGVNIVTEYSNTTLDYYVIYNNNKLYLKNYDIQKSKLKNNLNKRSNESFEFKINYTDLPPGLTEFGIEINTTGTLIKEPEKPTYLYHIDDGENAINLDFSDMVGLNPVFGDNYVQVKVNKNLYIDPTINFTSLQVESIDSVGLDNDSFAIAYCDEAGNDILFKIYNTDGTVELSQQTVDADVGSCVKGQVAVDRFNSTWFVIAFTDATDDDATAAIYKNDGTLINLEDQSESCGNSGAVDVSTFNSEYYIIVYYTDVTSSTQHVDGVINNRTNTENTAVGDETGGFISDTGDGGDLATIQSVSVVALNNSNWVAAWDDGYGDDIEFSLYDWTTKLYDNVDITATGGGGDAIVDLVEINSTWWVALYYDTTANDVTYRIFNTGTAYNTEQDFDADVGANVYVSVTGLNNTNNKTRWIGTFFDDTDDDFSYAIMRLNTTITSGDVNTAATSGTPFVSVTDNLCDNNSYVVSYVLSTTRANFTTYSPTGSIWDGECGAQIPDINITYGPAVSEVRYYVDWGTGTTASNVEPFGQTNTIGIFLVKNNGSADGNLTAKWNDTYTDVYTECGCNYFSSGQHNLTTSYQKFCEITQSSQTYFWCRRDYLAIPTKKNVGVLFNITTS